MGSKWRKALSCLSVPRTSDDSPPSAGRSSDAALLSRSASTVASGGSFSMPKTPTTSSSGLLLPKHGTKSSKRTCAICLNNMKPGQGHAIFTAECSHSFHFYCIASNVKHGNQICPICRATWKEIPFQNASDHSRERARVNTVGLAQDDDWTTVVGHLPSPRADPNRHVSSIFYAAEPNVFDDDERVDNRPEITESGLLNKDDADDCPARAIDVKTFPEVSTVSRLASHNNFTILIHLKALTSRRNNFGVNEANLSPVTQNSRASVDLVTVLDTSGSMAGTKLALLKQAMGFVIQHLGPCDRLSVIAFSSTARRLFPLRRMTDTGRQEALQAVNGLASNGGTNIAEGLRKGAKVMTDRKWKNPVGGMILLSDGQDTYNLSSQGGTHSRSEYQSLVPSTDLRIPVHAFGFGEDHDAALMHTVSESSGGTFSFIEAEDVIQDAFAQCIGGLLSVVVQDLQVEFECVHRSLQLGSIKAGSYKISLMPDSRMGSIGVGDLYAEEERDFLVTIDIPVDASCEEMPLLKVKCVYSDPITEEWVTLEEANELKIQRPETTGDLIVSVEVDRQRNRLGAAEAMEEARAAADRGDLDDAVNILKSCREALLETVSAQAGDQLCAALAAELKEMQERMVNQHIYESSGRAYVLSGLSSHMWQRATARGDSTNCTSRVQAYQTQSMVDMVTRSQTLCLGSSTPKPSVRPARSQTLCLGSSTLKPSVRPARSQTLCLGSSSPQPSVRPARSFTARPQSR
ncbi:LOW QUALITY PROTEIN: E3 ubiquitin-protein ligase WAV3-like [Actinidia eriantha]|uniref:LOW QUALITY PROTEIN: E3 ubiquitin-protein ligase WAV3-like n=1 Tax=Actinidia eriantha TaxID=165200 RepID=UPI00258D4BC3|nr:LOW QUALITY PROTEIN: E3 ubiquitin-protein ligase WAV3-like [Actinidia eriantha]